MPPTWGSWAGPAQATPQSSLLAFGLAHVLHAHAVGLCRRCLFDRLQLRRVAHSRQAKVPVLLCTRRHGGRSCACAPGDGSPAWWGHSGKQECMHGSWHAVCKCWPSVPSASCMSFASSVVLSRCFASSQANAVTFSTKSSATSCISYAASRAREMRVHARVARSRSHTPAVRRPRAGSSGQSATRAPATKRASGGRAGVQAVSGRERTSSRSLGRKSDRSAIREGGRGARACAFLGVGLAPDGPCVRKAKSQVRDVSIHLFADRFETASGCGHFRRKANDKKLRAVRALATRSALR